MLIQEVIEIARPFDRVHTLIADDPHASLDQSLAAAYRDGEQLCLQRAPSCRPVPPGNEVWVDIGTTYPRGNGVVIPLEAWAAGATHFFPRLDADLEIMPVGRDATQIRLMGRYDPPKGSATRGLDRRVLEELAETTIRSFLNRLGDCVHGSVTSTLAT